MLDVHFRQMPEFPLESDQARMVPQDDTSATHYRRLPPKFQRRLHEHAGEFEALARADQRKAL